MFRLPITQCLAPYRLRVSKISELKSEQFPGSQTFNEELDDSKNESLICGKLQAKQSHFSAEILSLLKVSFNSQSRTFGVETRGAVVTQDGRLIYSEGPGFSSKS